MNLWFSRGSTGDLQYLHRPAARRAIATSLWRALPATDRHLREQ